jgi:hypothetical protein
MPEHYSVFCWRSLLKFTADRPSGRIQAALIFEEGVVGGLRFGTAGFRKTKVDYFDSGTPSASATLSAFLR